MKQFVFVFAAVFGMTACSGSSDSAPPTDPGATSANATAGHSQTYDFTCTSSDSDFPSALSITTGTKAKVDATFDNMQHKGTEDPTYHPTAANEDFIRVQWDKDNDPWS